MDTKQTLIEILTELGIDSAEIADDTRLGTGLELDSTDMVEVSLELKRRLGVTVELEIERDLTVAEVSQLVDQAHAARLVASPRRHGST
jgi:acyl carrier protein